MTWPPRDRGVLWEVDLISLRGLRKGNLSPFRISRRNRSGEEFNAWIIASGNTVLSSFTDAELAAQFPPRRSDDSPVAFE